MTRKLDTSRRIGLAGLLALISFCAACSAGNHSSSLSAETTAQSDPGYRKPSPEEISAFMAKAKAADAMTDRLARCLAYPDIPGNHWPTGLARAHCNLVFGPHITAEQIGKYLDRGATAELDALFAKDLARHFSKTDFSEVIHSDVESIDESEQSNKLTQRWLEKAPNSPFALTLRAQYFRKMARSVRGEKYVKDTPPENMRRMSEYAQQAIDLYQQALKLEPRLMPAYGGLIALGRIDSRPDLVRWAFERSATFDPACGPLNVSMMYALSPKWGGSYSEMFALSKNISADLDIRPLLALSVTAPFVAKGDQLYDANLPSESMQVLSTAAMQSTDPEIFEDLARAMGDVGLYLHGSEIIMYLLEDSRFKVPKAWATRELGRDLAEIAKDPEWSIAVMQDYIVREPDNADGHFILATSYYYAKRSADGERQFLLAARDPDTRVSALAGIFNFESREKHLEKARHYYEMITKEFPGYAEKNGIVAP
jgi:tetratricopeptide (TPR) repeat protein